MPLQQLVAIIGVSFVAVVLGASALVDGLERVDRAQRLAGALLLVFGIGLIIGGLALTGFALSRMG